MPDFDPRQLILASASPRRLELLQRVGLLPWVHPADLIEEVSPGESPSDFVQRMAKHKAHTAANDPLLQSSNPYVLAADTIVVLDGVILQKPESKTHATQMLSQLSARSHQVLSAVHLLDRRDARERDATVCTEVQFCPLSNDTIARYVHSGEPMDKAGAYAIQGVAAAFVRSIHGSYSNVVGLPLTETLELLVSIGAFENLLSIPHPPPFETPPDEENRT